ncbi:hypothetical protein D3C85_1129220 [compost metagenome]
MAEDIEDHLGGAAVGHPVLRVHQQRVAEGAEHPLHGLDQLDPEHRRRRHDDGRRVVQQLLLQLAQGFPVQQAGGALEVDLAAPAAGAGVQHHQCRGGGQYVLPTIEGDQAVDQPVQGRAVEVVVGGCAGGQRLDLRQHFAEGIGVVAPALAEHVGQQRVADDALGEGMAVGGQLPLGGEVPVVGDVVVVEDHQRRQVRQHPCRAGQALAETGQARLFQPVALGLVGGQGGHLRIDQGPGHGRPHQQVHGQHLGESHQVIFGVAAGEDGFARATEEAFAQGLVALQRR